MAACRLPDAPTGPDEEESDYYEDIKDETLLMPVGELSQSHDRHSCIGAELPEASKSISSLESAGEDLSDSAHFRRYDNDNDRKNDGDRVEISDVDAFLPRHVSKPPNRIQRSVSFEVSSDSSTSTLASNSPPSSCRALLSRPSSSSSSSTTTSSVLERKRQSQQCQRRLRRENGGGSFGVERSPMSPLETTRSRRDMIRRGIGSTESVRRMAVSDRRSKRLAALGLTPEDVKDADDDDCEALADVACEGEGGCGAQERPDDRGLLEEGQNYLAMSMLVYIYALLREMAVLGYTETDFRSIDVNRWVRWFEEPEDDEDDSGTEDATQVSSYSASSSYRGSDVESDIASAPGDDCDDRDNELSVAQPSSNIATRAMLTRRSSSMKVRRCYGKYLSNTRTAGSIIRCILEELEREYQRAEKEDRDMDMDARAGQHDISVIKEFQHWVDDSRCDQEDDAAEKTIKELQRQVAKKRWRRAVKTVMARSRFKFILAAAKASREIERANGDEDAGARPRTEESIREKMERKKEAVKRQLEKEMKEGGGKGTNVNSWFTLQKRVIQSHFDDEAGEDEEAREENAKRRPNQSMINRVMEESLPSFFKPGSVLSLMMEQGIEVVYFGDRHPNEAIYCVCVCRRSKTVTVVFRGSVTAHNWMHNIKLMMSDQPNPLAREMYEGRSDYLKLHTGFGLYMLRRRKDTRQTKIGEISERIHRIGRELAPDGRYRVAVTGHSLGGALATIFSFYAACDERFTTLGPVRTFTFAAPRVGDEQFRSAYERLERSGRLRHARFSNTKDIVPLTPTFSVHRMKIGPWYKHVGLQVKLHETTGLGMMRIAKSVDASYARDKSRFAEMLRALSRGNNFLLNLTTIKGFGKNHSLSEHQRRLNFVYQYRRQLLEDDLRGETKFKLKSMEEYYRIKAGFGNAKVMKESKYDGRRMRVKSRLIVFVVVVSALAVTVYKFSAACPVGVGMVARHYKEAGEKEVICGVGAVEMTKSAKMQRETTNGASKEELTTKSHSTEMVDVVASQEKKEAVANKSEDDNVVDDVDGSFKEYVDGPVVEDVDGTVSEDVDGVIDEDADSIVDEVVSGIGDDDEDVDGFVDEVVSGIVEEDMDGIVGGIVDDVVDEVAIDTGDDGEDMDGFVDEVVSGTVEEVVDGFVDGDAHNTFGEDTSYSEQDLEGYIEFPPSGMKNDLNTSELDEVVGIPAIAGDVDTVLLSVSSAEFDMLFSEGQMIQHSVGVISECEALGFKPPSSSQKYVEAVPNCMGQQEVQGGKRVEVDESATVPEQTMPVAHPLEDFSDVDEFEFSNTPWNVLGPIFAHIAGRLLPPY